MRGWQKSSGVCAFTLLCMTAAHAQTISNFTLTDNGATYTETNLMTSRTGGIAGLADFIVGGVDQMYQNWWWYRGQGDTREYALSNQTFGSAAGNSALLVYSEEVAGNPGALEFSFNYTLNGISPTHAILSVEWTVTNRTNQTLPVNFFPYMDADIGGTAGGDFGQLVSFGPMSGEILAYEGAGQMSLRTAVIQGATLSAWEIDRFPNIRIKLADTDTDNLSNNFAFFGPDDFSSAYQYQMTLAPFDSAYGTLTKEFTPEPGTLMLLGAGIVAVSRRLRRA